MQLGTNEEIEKQIDVLNKAEEAHTYARLRLRALKGDALFQTGDSFNAFFVEQGMHRLASEFGSRNLRAF